MARPFFVSLAGALLVVSIGLALAPTGGGTTYFSGRGDVGGGDCGSSYTRSLSYRRETANDRDTYGCLPETAPRTAWALLAGWGSAAAVALAVLRKERIPRRLAIGAPLAVVVVLIVSTGIALWRTAQ